MKLVATSDHSLRGLHSKEVGAMASYAREGSAGRTWGLAELLLEQLGSQPMFMDIDIIPGVWISRRLSRRQHWEAEPLKEASQASKGKSANLEVVR